MASHPLLACALSPDPESSSGYLLRAELVCLSLCPANGHATSGVVVARSMPTALDSWSMLAGTKHDLGAFSFAEIQSFLSSKLPWW